MEPANICVVGVGGYGRSHVRSVHVLEEENLARFSAVVIRNQDKYAKEVAPYKERNTPVYSSFEEMLEAERGQTEIVALPVSIHLHKDMTIAALEKGYNVIVEKPPAVTVQDLDAMIEAERKSGKFCAVGFQWQSNSVAKELKEKICSGELGEVRDAAVKGLWKRTDTYYLRNSWAGKFFHDGRYVIDGTIGNPLAHYLMLALCFSTKEKDRAAELLRVRAELYRGHDMEAEDTSALVARTDSQANVYFFATLCAASQERGPLIEVVGSEGKARWPVQDDAYIEYACGKKEVLEWDGVDPRVEVFRNAVRYLKGEEESLNCPLPLTRPYVLALNGAYESAKVIRQIPRAFIEVKMEDGQVATHIRDIEEIIERAFRERKLYSELGVEWAVPTDYFPVVNYSFFDMKLDSSSKD